MIRTIAFMTLLALSGCGNGSPGGGGGGGSGGGGSSGSVADLATPPPDLANAFVCGNTVCMGGQKCCVTGTTPACAASCNTDLGFEAECNSPANCGGNPCCITIGAGFTVQSVVCATSASACPPMVDTNTQSGMDRACTVDADCTAGLASATQLPDCCTNTASHQKVCFNKAALGIPGVMGFTCP
jgi:hypothetical protein